MGRTYNAPMLDIKLIRERADYVRQRLATRGAGDEARVDELLKLDEQRRKLLGEVESLKAQRKRVSKEIGALMGQKKTRRQRLRRPKLPTWATASRRSTSRRRKRKRRGIN